MGQGQEVKTRIEPQNEAHSADNVQRLYIVLRPESGERAVEEKQDSDSGEEGAKKGCIWAHNLFVWWAFRFPTMGDAMLGNSASQVSLLFHQSSPLFFQDDHLSSLVPSLQNRQPLQLNLPCLFIAKLSRTVMIIPLVGERRGPILLPLSGGLVGKECDTKTKGHRRTTPARALGEGIYRISRHKPGKKTHTHLIYKLELPPQDEKNESQESLNIEPVGSFLIQIKNPDRISMAHPSSEGYKTSARLFPAHLHGFAPLPTDRCRGKKFNRLQANPPDFLNYKGCEFLLISASDDIEEELGLELKTEGESDVSCFDLVRTFGETASTSALF
ncbi:hypothetical protein ACB092_03G095000 [Castanea dentata]